MTGAAPGALAPRARGLHAVSRGFPQRGLPADPRVTRPTDANTVYGGSGADGVAAYDGDDTISVRDGEVDTLGRGAGADMHVADAFDEGNVSRETDVG